MCYDICISMIYKFDGCLLQEGMGSKLRQSMLPEEVGSFAEFIGILQRMKKDIEQRE